MRTVRAAVLRRLAALDARSDSGAASAFVVAIAVSLLLVGGLVIDGGRTLNARAAAADDAEQAARAGADRIDVAELRVSGTVRIDTGAAQAAARAYCSDRDYGAGDCDVPTPTGNTVTVTTHRDVEAAILSIIPGLGTFSVSATATAEAVQGIDGPLP